MGKQTEHKCKQCGASFLALNSKGREFCSRKCVTDNFRGVERTKTRIEVSCLECGKVMLRYPSHVRERNFCSQSCKARACVATLNNNRRSPKEYAKPPVRYGAENKKYVPAVEHICKFCGITFFRKPWQTRGGGSTGEYCSANCRNRYRKENQSGENSPHWVGGIKTYRGRDWKVSRIAAVSRDGGICRGCGKMIGESIPVHHIIPFREFNSAEEANSVDNLICYCQSCHMRNEPRPKKTT